MKKKANSKASVRCLFKKFSIQSVPVFTLGTRRVKETHFNVTRKINLKLIVLLWYFNVTKIIK